MRDEATAAAAAAAAEASVRPPIAVVGIGLDGAAGLLPAARQVVEQATVLVGSDRHLAYFPAHPAKKIPLGKLQPALEQIRQRLDRAEAASPQAVQAARTAHPPNAHNAETRDRDAPDSGMPKIVVLASGDPLFFGIGRLLLQHFAPAQLAFYPHLSSVQLAFSRIKQPWQDAHVLSLHGRSPERLIQALQAGTETIAVLTDDVHTPGAIARLLCDLKLPSRYQLWVCENLGSATEQVRAFAPAAVPATPFAPLSVVILQRQAAIAPLSAATLAALPLFGIPDALFASFGDRPGLMTKREVRTLALGELSLPTNAIVWDIGAGTGAVAVEMARLRPQAQVFAIEKTAAGIALIHQNRQRFQCSNLIPHPGEAPAILHDLPAPDRVFVGGSGGQLIPILEHVAAVLSPQGVVVLAIATLDHLSAVMQWLQADHPGDRWDCQTLQVHLSRSVAIATLTRLQPLNPVFLVRLQRLET